MHRFTVETVVVVVVVALQLVTSFNEHTVQFATFPAMDIAPKTGLVLEETWAEEAYIRPALYLFDLYCAS